VDEHVVCLVSGSGLNDLNATVMAGRMTGPLAPDEIDALDPVTIS
jgi:hypothetical protein